jgi:hypothetical protein
LQGVLLAELDLRLQPTAGLIEALRNEANKHEMNRSGCALAFLLGAATVGWVGVGFVGSNTLALVMTAIIGAVYLFGAFEILEFRRATSTLAVALAAIPEQLSNLADWLDRLHPSLQNPCVCA